MEQNKKFLPCKFTDRAIKEILDTVENKKIPAEYGLRIGIRGGGCSGISYLLGFDTGSPSDERYQLEGIPVYIEKKHMMYVLGKTIDFEDSGYTRGFVFNEAEDPATKSQ